MVGNGTDSGGRELSLRPTHLEAKTPVLQVGALIAVGAAAVFLVTGIGAYLYIRFTQNRSKPPH